MPDTHEFGRVTTPHPGGCGPRWSVMIPVCNRTTYLRQTLDSVLQQSLPPEEMQIAIVDNSTSPIDWHLILTTDEQRRVEIITQKSHVSIGANWNTCITASRGHLIHILHDDDWVLRGFYSAIDDAACRFPHCALYGCRAFYVDEDGIITGVSPRLRCLENSGAPKDIYLEHLSRTENPIQCPGIVVTRQAYDVRGLFSPTLRHVTDCEMWSRLIDDAWHVSSDPLCCYRTHHGNYSTSLTRSADNLREISLLNETLAAKHPGFDLALATRTIQRRSLDQALRYRVLRDDEAAAANLKYYRSITPLNRRAATATRTIATRLVAYGSRLLRRHPKKPYIQ